MITENEYKRIIEADKKADTLFIDVSGFRKLLTRKIDAAKLEHLAGIPLEADIKNIVTLTYIDSASPIVVALFSVIGFGWLGILGIPVAFMIWFLWKTHACKGVQKWNDVTVIGMVLAFFSTALPLPSLWARLAIMMYFFIFLIGRLLYWATAQIVFQAIHESYPFFKLFYLEPKNAIIPLIWTSEWNEQQRIMADENRTDILAEYDPPKEIRKGDAIRKENVSPSAKEKEAETDVLGQEIAKYLVRDAEELGVSSEFFYSFMTNHNRVRYDAIMDDMTNRRATEGELHSLRAMFMGIWFAASSGERRKLAASMERDLLAINKYVKEVF
jgi:hypothetical protein